MYFVLAQYPLACVKKGVACTPVPHPSFMLLPALMCVVVVTISRDLGTIVSAKQCNNTLSDL
jgi:hypothetical protein